jgi:TorA maturation chaperone TorD
MAAPTAFSVNGSMKDQVCQLAAVSDTYLLLATFMRLPTKAIVEDLNNGRVEQGIRALLGDLQLLQSGRETSSKVLELLHSPLIRAVTLSELRSEYTRLFSHPDQPLVQPTEGSFLFFLDRPGDTGCRPAPRLFINPAALDAERIYKKAGFECSSALQEPADTIYTELEFMHRLYQAKLTALQSDDRDAGDLVDECLNEFTHNHLGKWAVAFFKAVVDNSKIDFYRAVGILGAAFIRSQLVC